MNLQDKSHLSISEIPDVTPLGLTTGGDQSKCVPDALQDVFFHQPELTQDDLDQYGTAIAVPKMKTYAIVDASRMPYLLTGLLASSGLSYQSLFQGKAGDELEEAAPYLVCLEDGNKFTRSLFLTPSHVGGLWGKGLGVFVRSRASFSTVRKHLRQYTRLKDEAEKWFYFRFWDPDNFYVTSALRDDPQSPFLRIWMGPLIAEVLFPLADTVGLIRVQPAPTGTLGPLRLSKRDTAAIQHAKKYKFLHRVAVILHKEHPELWGSTNYEELEAFYTDGFSRKYTIEKAAYDFIRCRLAARLMDYSFDEIEKFIDPKSILSPLNRSEQIWAFLKDKKGDL